MSIGETLEQARHQAGLSVAQVSEQTRIRPPIIRSIEADDYEACGGDFYARGDIRSIAEVVGTDPEPLIQEYDQAHRASGPVAATSLDELLERSRPQWHRRPGFMLVFGLGWTSAFATIASRRAFTCGISRSFTFTAAVIFMAVGKVSLEDCDMLT